MKFSVVLTLMALGGSLASGSAFTSTPTDVCPAPYAGDSDGQSVSSTYIANTTISGTQATGTVTGNTGCNVLITFNSDGSITSTFPNAAISYDGGLDDNLIGVVNNTSAPITSLFLSGGPGNDIFGFDGDGICGTPGGTLASGSTLPGYSFVGGGNPCVNSVDPSDYGGPYVTYTGVGNGSTTGTVNFGNGGIDAGGSTFFSLEGPVDVTLMISSGTPEPASESCLIQDEPGGGDGFSYKMSLKGRFRMLGIDHSHGRERETEPGANPGVSRGQRGGVLPGAKPGRPLRVGEPDVAPAKL